MLISYRDSRRFPSDPLALKTWVKLAEMAARQVACGRDFDAPQFARALEICRRLTTREGPEASVKRMIVTCAAAGVAVVLVPAIKGCHASSASRWLMQGRRAMIALSIRYRRDDQLYFSLFREAGAILAASRRVKVFDPDRFAREFVVPPEQEHRLCEVVAGSDQSSRKSELLDLASELQIAPGLLVGRLQHDGLITWKQHNCLKRQVDLCWVLEGAEAMEETWPDQSSAADQVMHDFGLDPRAARERVRRAAASGRLVTNGQRRTEMRFEPGALAAWRLLQRDKDLDAEEAA